MIISDEQARLALEYLHTRNAPFPARPLAGTRGRVPADLAERVRVRLEGTPELRDDRVAEGRLLVASGVSSDDVAAKMIWRIISDSIR